MLIWMCALHCEAKPVIDFYRLKKSPAAAEFDLYSNDQVSCIVSGVGAKKMASATKWAARRLQHEPQLCWINIGIAGHADLAIGSTVLASQVTQSGNPIPINTECTINHPFGFMPVTSHAGEQSNYNDSTLVDMEAYAFMQTASHHSPIKWCQSIKIISDNRNTPPSRNKARISGLIAENMQAIADFAETLQYSAL